MANNASRDQNSVPTLLAVSSADFTSTVTVYADPTTHRLLVQTIGGANQAFTGNTTVQGFSPAIVTKAANYTATTSDFTILADATAGNITITLPTGGTNVFNVKKIDVSANTVTVLPSSGAIDGVANKVISTQYTNIQAQANGTNLYTL